MHVELQPVRDLLGTPRLRPPPIGPTPVTPADEPDLGARNPLAVGSADLTGEPGLHIVAEPLIGHQLRSLGPTSLQLRLPLRDRSSIVEPATPSRRVPSQLAEIVDGDRPDLRATARTPRPCTLSNAIPRVPRRSDTYPPEG